MCAPLYSTAQSQPAGYAVSVRELSIPPKALHAFEQGVELLAKKDPAGSLPHFQRAIAEYAGYYEAYDTVLTHAEKMNLQVLWFREKRSCEPFLNRDFPDLEAVCTYCNKKFNHSEPVPCSQDGCNFEFCSRDCMAEHHTMRHRA